MDSDIYNTEMLPLKDEISMLKDKVAHLQSKLDESENQKIMAAKFGQQLLEEKGFIEAAREDERASYTAKLEEFTQENFNLAAKVEAQSRMLEVHSRDNDDEIKHKHQQEIELLQSSYEKKLNEVKKEKSVTDDELAQMNLKLHQKTEVIENLQRTLAEQKKNNKIMEANTNLEGEMQELKNALQSCYNEKCLVEENLGEAVHDLQRKNLEVDTLMKRMSDLREELEGAQKEQIVCLKQLEDAKNSITELNVEKSQLEADLKSRGHSKKGNSLFGELEDRRVVAERNLAVFKVRYDSLKNAHAAAKSEILKMKNQVLIFLQTRSDRADRMKIEHLENDLSLAKSESNMLAARLHAKEEQEKSRDPLKEVREYLGTCKTEDSKEYVRLLLVTSEEFKKKIESIENEAKKLRLALIAKGDELKDTQRKLYTAVNASDKHRNEALRTKISFDEMKNKFDEEKQKRLASEELIKKLSSAENTNDTSQFKLTTKELAKTPILPIDKKRRNDFVPDRTFSDSDTAVDSGSCDERKPESPPKKRELTDEEKKERGKRLMMQYLPKELAEEFLQKESQQGSSENADNTLTLSRKRKLRLKERKVSFKDQVDLLTDDDCQMKEENQVQKIQSSALKQECEEPNFTEDVRRSQENCQMQ